MEAIKAVVGKALPLGYNHVDTDQIAPSDCVKFSTRVDLSDFLFKDWRENPDFIMNDTRYDNSVILIAGENFGCGSSREHAPWALQDYGFKAIIASSFADIFKNNCSKVGLLTISLSESELEALTKIVKNDPSTVIEVSLENCTVTCKDFKSSFAINENIRQKLLNGLNDIEMTLLYDKEITEFENSMVSYLRR